MSATAAASQAEQRGTILDAAQLDPEGPLFQLLDEVHEQSTVTAGGLWGASQALVLAVLTRKAQGPWLVVTASDEESQLLRDDLASFGVESQWLPARESYSSQSGAHPDPERIRMRLQMAQAMAGPPDRRPRLTLASVLSLLQPIPASEDLDKDFLGLNVHATLDAEELLERLIASGYVRQPLAETPGEVSLRGDILDIYPFASELPLRIELFDREIERLGSFDPADQRSLDSLDKIKICLAKDAGGIRDGEGVQPTSALSPTTVIVQIEPLRIEDRAEGLRIQSGSHARALLQLRDAISRHRRVDLQSLPAETLNFDTRSVQGLAVGMREAPGALRETASGGTRAVVLCQNAAEQHRFEQLLGDDREGAHIETRIGPVSRGFRFPALDLVVVNHHELVGVLGRRRVKKRPATHRARVIQSFFELKAGDYVVHAVNGLARFEGLTRLRRGAGEEEHMKLVFADEVSLFVPVCRIDMVQRYIGTGGGSPTLDKLGGSSFRKRKERVERALFDLASELLEVQAQRALRTRPAWRGDEELERDMIGSFPYTDTPDQALTDTELKKDLAGSQPMDRLICGDVGFGKTELAIRAAFRVVSGGGQVAILVPTTVLAQQHYDTLRERLADFPVEVALLNRYVSAAPSKLVVERTERGEVDILIGTHRILSKDVKFKNLGLVIVDEEQRFGVIHKEHFKKLRSSMDLLTLTATPIPRTLHMSLSGLRDISALATPPEGRQEIETILCYAQDHEKIREALLREKNRSGQVFFLHNRVQSIGAVGSELAKLVPECSFALGHGQMGAVELKRVMQTFARGEVDVLVATTIIESGIDIPSAGTIVVDAADNFGLSELHQLRGRVGRGPNKAYCYLLVDKYKPLRQVARDRLKALEEMNQLGAGFAISMKDLEIRGAGNILGPQQSGHITAVGYDMYCRLLKQAVERLQAAGSSEVGPLESLRLSGEEAGVELELELEAYLPEEWIPSQNARLELMRELSLIGSSEDAERAGEMLRDRFGRLPLAATNLLRMFRLRSQLEPMGVRRLSWRDESYLIEYVDRVALERHLGGGEAELRPIRTGIAHIPIPTLEGVARSPEQALVWFEGLLKSPEGTSTMAPAG